MVNPKSATAHSGLLESQDTVQRGRKHEGRGRSSEQAICFIADTPPRDTQWETWRRPVLLRFVISGGTHVSLSLLSYS